ncbi:MAG: M20/M25/M40 family metallo-hydrolase [Tannerellaceae bacterium]|jgi:hypothetical protein|nr:M20/M25/M40 family metallo-hydrolase [Tannerellaceae bacterium]
MNKRLFLFLACTLCTAIPVLAQTKQPDELAYKIKSEAFSNSQVEDMAQWFTDYLGPRLAASPNGLKAEVLAMDKLTSYGLSGSRVEYAAPFPKGGWENEHNYVAMTSPYYCSFSATPRAWSGSTAGLVSADVVYLNVEKAEDLEQYRGKLSGKIVLMPPVVPYEMSFEPLASRISKDRLAELSQDPRPQGSTRYMRYFRMNDLTPQLQASITQLIAEEKPVAILRGSGTFNIPMSNGMQYTAGDAHPLPEINLPTEDHGRMARLIAKNIPVTMEIDVRNSFHPADTLINNVIAEIPGVHPRLKNEIVLIGAHFDSWHGGTGAADNASGCIVMLEAMRILKAIGISPSRTIRIALWGGEEQGLYGSRGYASNNLYDREKKTRHPGYDNFVLYLNMDNGSGRFRGIYLEENDMAIPFFKTWMSPLESLGFTTLSLRRTGSTDHVAFSTLGLPAFQFIQDPLEYGRTYHTLMDTYERLSLDDLRINAAIVAWFALNAAQDNARIPSKPGVLEKLQAATNEIRW